MDPLVIATNPSESASNGGSACCTPVLAGDPGRLVANGPRLSRPFAPAAKPIASALIAPKEPIFADWERA